jgi:signal transduction histidine kinase
VRASLQGNGRRLTGTQPRARTFWLCFAIPAVLTAVYATVLSRELVAWQAATACWVLTLLLIWLIGRLASMIEQCEREAVQDGWSVTPIAKARRSDEIQRAAQIQKRVAHLEQIIVRQHHFIADAAHELRTPLTALSIIGENVLVKKSLTGAQLRDVIASMLEESKHMKRLIEGLLDLTRASLATAANQDALPVTATVDLSDLARDCVETLRILAEEKRQCLEVNVAGPLWANADLTLVRQAVLNVIHNAIEHCLEGAHIRVETGRCPPEQGLIRVQDDGPGIPLEEQHNVFERFYRGAGGSRNANPGPPACAASPARSDAAVPQRRRGLGLGLSIAKAILCSQGGGIELRSRPGAGSCFILTLPLAPDFPPRPSPSEC